MALGDWKKGKVYQMKRVDGVMVGVYVDPEESTLGKKKKANSKKPRNGEK